MSITSTSTGLLITKTTVDGARLLRFGWNGKETPVNLPSDVSPTHAVETSDGCFIVCQKLTCGGAVTKFNAGGEKMCHYPVADSPYNFDPCYATLGYGDMILVADAAGSQVIVLNPRLEHEHALRNEKHTKIEQIRKLCFDERSGKLFVGHNSCAVSVYKMPPASDRFVM